MRCINCVTIGPPMLERSFRADEDQAPGRDAVAVLGYDVWKNDFGASPDVVGRTMFLNGIGFTVIGWSCGSASMRVLHVSRGRPFTSAEHEPHLPALQFQRTARSGA